MAIRIGDLGHALTTLTPSGVVEVNGRRLDARSEFGVIEAGSPVVIVRSDPTGFVVRKPMAGEAAPNRGAVIVASESQRTAAEVAEVAEVERSEKAEARKKHRLSLRVGVIAAASLGVLVGMTSGCVGWYLGWTGQTEPSDFLTLVGGKAGVGLFAGVVLFVFTGVVGKVLGAMEGEPDFSPNFVVTFAALVGAAAGFWWRYDSPDAGSVAVGIVLGAAVFAAGGYVLGWLGGKIGDALTGS